MHRAKKHLVFITIISLLLLFIHAMNGSQKNTFIRHISANTNSNPLPFISSVDTMKESRDTQTRPLSNAEITQDVHLSASLNPTHITVATNWDYTDYFRRWVQAIHAEGKRVWVRGHPNQWENNNHVSGMMTPGSYIAYEKNFILQNADVFLPGDIFDTCSESEGGSYWKSLSPWSSQTKAAYNQFIRDSIDTANAAFSERGVKGVITTIHSTNAYIASHRLEPETIEKMGVVTIDSYPDQYDTSVSLAVDHRIDEINAVYNSVHVPVILGEIGYSNKIQVDDQLQKNVLHAQLQAIAQLPFITGVNYWVGAGGIGYGGYTNIFSGSRGKWVLRPAAYELQSFFQLKNAKNQ